MRIPFNNEVTFVMGSKNKRFYRTIINENVYHRRTRGLLFLIRLRVIEFVLHTAAIGFLTKHYIVVSAQKIRVHRLNNDLKLNFNNVWHALRRVLYIRRQ